MPLFSGFSGFRDRFAKRTVTPVQHSASRSHPQPPVHAQHLAPQNHPFVPKHLKRRDGETSEDYIKRLLDHIQLPAKQDLAIQDVLKIADNPEKEVEAAKELRHALARLHAEAKNELPRTALPDNREAPMHAIMRLVDKYLKLKDENLNLKDENLTLKDENQKLKDENLELKHENQKLKHENQELKQENRKRKDGYLELEQTMTDQDRVDFREALDKLRLATTKWRGKRPL